MISFDNGPAHGDYVRYIDDLMARAALATAAAVASGSDMSTGPDDPTRDRSSTIARVEQARSGSAGGSTPGWSTAVTNLRGRRPDPVGESGFAPATATSPAITAAAAIASALMSGQVGRRATASTGNAIALIAIVVGLVLMAVGVLVQPFNLALVVGGGALIAWALRNGRSRNGDVRRST